MNSKKTKTEDFGASHCYASHEHCENQITLQSMVSSMHNFTGDIFVLFDNSKNKSKRTAIKHSFYNGVLKGFSDYEFESFGNCTDKLVRPTTKCGTSDASSLKTNMPISSHPKPKYKLSLCTESLGVEQDTINVSINFG